MKKEIYSRPMAEFLDLEIEDNLLQTTSPYIPGGGGSYGDDDTNNNGDF